MNRMIICALLLLVFNFCAENKNIITSGNSIQFGTESTLDVITWNIENFPKQDETTVNYLAELIEVRLIITDVLIDFFIIEEQADDNARLVCASFCR